MGDRSQQGRRRCTLPVPYPEPQVVAPNAYYANLLLEDYAGVTSELTAINQYLYHHFTVNEEYEDLNELWKCISIVEMKHEAMLAETILLLGVAPEYRTLTNNFPVYWSASYVYYGVEVCDRLTADIAGEKEAIQNYRKHQDLIADPYINQLLERIIMDEEHHLKLFYQVAAKYCPRWEEVRD